MTPPGERNEMVQRETDNPGVTAAPSTAVDASVYERIRQRAGGRIGDLMTREVVTIDAATNLAEAEQLMRLRHVRHLPVLHDGQLVGLVTHRDLLRALADAFRDFGSTERAWLGARRVAQSLRAEQIMTRTVLTIHPDATLLQAAHLLRHNKFGCLPVLADGRVVGIVTEADFLALAIDALEPPRADDPEGEDSHAR